MQRAFGPHVRQALRLARRARRGDVCFADGEHIGLPLLLFLAFSFRRNVRVVMLGHLVDRPWKKALFWVGTRLVPGGTLALHSEMQLKAVSPWLATSWRRELIPYQVDTAFWQPGELFDNRTTRPAIVAVGSEFRDYATLVAAAGELPVDLTIAAGSHWARKVAAAGGSPANVEYLARPLPFDELRRAYQTAAIVVVPLEDVANQAGVTTILEAMSMGRPVVVTATRGQRECVSGPLMKASGELDAQSTAERGPQRFGHEPEGDATGLYVPPGDASALRSAIEWVLADSARSEAMGGRARSAACRHFTVERYVQHLAGLLTQAPQTDGTLVARTMAT